MMSRPNPSRPPLEPPRREHPHPAPVGQDAAYDVLVVGGGHAGAEAVLAAARLGARAALITHRFDRIGEMSCNPAIGGLGKGQLAREVDALGGVMGRAIDATGIQFRMLNTRKGFAVRAPRAQADRHLYREAVHDAVLGAAGVDAIEGAVARLIVREERGEKARVEGVVLDDGREVRARATILTTGTFLAAVIHRGEDSEAGGRVGEAACEDLSAVLTRLGLPIGRLKTGTPPRLDATSIAWERLEEQSGDEHPVPFSFATPREGFPRLPQISCHVTFTNPATHDLIRANIHRSPMYAGRIHGVGPRYCPSVEDKVMRFADRSRHQVFLEREGLETDDVYVNGLSTSLPPEIQEAFVHTVEGLESARFVRHGYAVEYDFVLPHALDPTLAAREVSGLYLAGQLNGTSGYEEAAAQGLIAGTNAARWVADESPFLLARHEAYTGVLIDDLVVSSPTEPYRMFTSRAEYRLLLRQDDADRRLVPRAAEIGLVDEAAIARLAARERRLAAVGELLRAERSEEHGGRTFLELLRRPEVTLADLVARSPRLAALEIGPDDTVTVEADVKYEGYAERARGDVERMKRRESREIPAEFDFATLEGLRGEAREKLAAMRPRTLGAAGRIAGINPPDLALLSVHLERHRRTREGGTGGARKGV